MKKHLFKIAFLAVAGLALAAQHAQAQGSYTPDDLLLTVYQTTNNTTTEYTINLGLASQYMTGGAEATASSGNAISLGNYGADLTAVFGAWNTTYASTTFWSIVGTAGNIGVGTNTTGLTTQGEYIDTMFVSNSETTPGTQSSAWTRANKSTQGEDASPVTTYGSSLSSSSSSYNANALTGPNAVVYGSSNSTGYVKEVSPTDSVGGAGYPGAGGFAMEDSFSQGTGAGGATLDLFRLTPTTSVSTPPAGAVIPPAGQIYVGSFNFSSTGQLDFSTNADSFAPIPEPSTYAFLGFGTLLLGVWYRRRIQRTLSV